jgi:hypothetical protein
MHFLLFVGKAQFDTEGVVFTSLTAENVSLPALSLFDSRFKLFSSLHPLSHTNPLVLLWQIDKPQGFLLQRVTQMFAEGKHSLRERSGVVATSRRMFKTLVS